MTNSHADRIALPQSHFIRRACIPKFKI
uniref:Uncharacterized protein n=1 Tax=Arundo donax TaxID=35708 RepID=A0A0A9HNR5_ARUDO